MAVVVNPDLDRSDWMCGGNITITSAGYLTSPGYPSGYPPSQQCMWLISAPIQHQRILVNFNPHFDLESPECKYDFLEVYDGDSEKASLVGKYCGKIAPSPITSSGNLLLIKFTSDYETTGAGFSIRYEIHRTGTECSRNLTALSGLIKTPGFPDNYSNNLECTFIIFAPKMSEIVLEFESFDMETDNTGPAGASCRFDYLEIWDGYPTVGPHIGRYCGPNSPGRVVSYTGILSLFIHTDNAITKEGFSSNYRIQSNHEPSHEEANECLSPLGMESGEITDDRIASSSQYNPSWSPFRSRLNYRDNGWTPSEDSAREWIQVDLGFLRYVSAIGIQGAVSKETKKAYYVKTYKVSISTNGEDWTMMKDGTKHKVGCELEEKERFWSELDEVMESIPTGERVVIGADFNGHVGEGNTGDEEVMGKFGVKERNLEGQMVVDFAKRMDMAVVNTYFQKREEHRVTYKSGGRRTQVDYILCRRGNLKEISDCKVVVGESVARQHRMVVCRMTLMVYKTKRSKIEKKTKWWKLKKEECCEEFRQKLRQALGGQVVLPDDWETTAEVIRETGRKVLGVSSGRRKEDKETWWWNEEVQDSIQRKRLAKKKWDMDRTEENRQEYKELQRRVKREVSKAKQKAYEEMYTRLDTREGEKDLYRLGRQRDRDGKDVQQKVDKIRKDEVRKALNRMKSGKAVGPDDIPVEVWKCLGEAAVEFLANLFNRVLENLEKAYDRVPREELWYCMRKSGVAEKYVRVVQDMYERSRTVVRCAVVMDQLSEEVRQESPWTMMFADDIVICSESREQVEENLERWRFALERRGMKVSRIQSNGECGKEVKKRVQAETVSLRKRQESELEVAELKMLRFSLGVTRLDRIRNEYIRGTAHVGRLGDKVREARLRWFGHVQRRESCELEEKERFWSEEGGA
ncbi:hypothetical protein QTP86_003335 [Hemibagrus guttatus]|nr:hypothetical protein QTP86_003335 [Hemibagrus guttatus]